MDYFILSAAFFILCKTKSYIYVEGKKINKNINKVINLFRRKKDLRVGGGGGGWLVFSW